MSIEVDLSESPGVSTHRSNIRWLMAIMWGGPAILLVCAYAYMTLRYDKLWLFSTIVHENGKYTLFEVMFYFRHFCWELSIKTLYACVMVGAFFYYGNGTSSPQAGKDKTIPAKKLFWAGVWILFIVALTVFMSSRVWGLQETLAGLLQYRTAETKPALFGSHWRNHFISNIVLFAASCACVLLYRMIWHSGNWARRRYANLLCLSLSLFAAITLIYGMNWDPFTKPSYLGHQLREIFGADLPVTMPLALALLIFLEKKYDLIPQASSRPKHGKAKENFLHLSILLLPVILGSVFLIFKVLNLNISSEITRLGRTNNWSTLDLFAWHFFEHWLDYIYVLSCVYFLYLSLLRRSLSSQTTNAP